MIGGSKGHLRASLSSDAFACASSSACMAGLLAVGVTMFAMAGRGGLTAGRSSDARRNNGAAQQRDEADEAKRNEASQLIPSVGQTSCRTTERTRLALRRTNSRWLSRAAAVIG